MTHRSPLVALFAIALFALPAAAQEAAAPAAEGDAAPAAKGDAAPAAEGDAAPAAEGDAAPDAAAAADEADAASDGEAEDEGASTPDPTEAPAAVQTGSLTISSSPNGKVLIDGEDTGLSTPLIDHAVAPGTHTVKIVDEATGRTKEVTFHLDAGAVLNLNVNLPEAAPVDAPVAATSQPAEATEGEGAAPATVADAAATQEDDWTWMTVAGWASLGVGTLGLLAGAVILTTPTDLNQGPLGFGLFGAGAGLVLGGGVLLYLDSELAGGSDDPQLDDAAAEEESEATAGLFSAGRTALLE